MVTAINAQTSFTGISAATNADGALELTENFNGEIKITDVEIDGVDFAEGEVEYFANFTSYDGTGEVVGEIRKLTDTDQIVGTSVKKFERHYKPYKFPNGFRGAQINKVDSQT